MTTAAAPAFQQAASRQGRRFEDTVETLLRIDGWTIVALNWKEPITGLEIDRVAIDPAGSEWWIECKGSWEGPAGSRGARRGDTAKKAVGVAWRLSLIPESERRPYLLVTSHMPAEGTVAADLIATALRVGLFSALRCVGSTT